MYINAGLFWFILGIILTLVLIILFILRFIYRTLCERDEATNKIEYLTAYNKIITYELKHQIALNKQREAELVQNSEVPKD